MKAIQMLPAVLEGFKQDKQQIENFEKLCRGIAHDLRNPAATISMEAQSLKIFLDRLKTDLKSPASNPYWDTLEAMESIAENILSATQVLEKFADDLNEVEKLAHLPPG